MDLGDLTSGMFLKRSVCCVRVAAAGMVGVVQILTVADIPAGGRNDVGAAPGQEKMFLAAGDTVTCVGQSVALVLADTFEHALAAARAVVISYSAASTAPIFTIAVRIQRVVLPERCAPLRRVVDDMDFDKTER